MEKLKTKSLTDIADILNILAKRTEEKDFSDDKADFVTWLYTADRDVEIQISLLNKDDKYDDDIYLTFKVLTPKWKDKAIGSLDYDYLSLLDELDELSDEYNGNQVSANELSENEIKSWLAKIETLVRKLKRKSNNLKPTIYLNTLDYKYYGYVNRKTDMFNLKAYDKSYESEFQVLPIEINDKNKNNFIIKKLIVGD